MSENQPQVSVHKSTEDLELSAAEEIAAIIREAIGMRGVAFIALSGGETPRNVYQRLGREPLRSQVDWSRVHLFFSDERAVPPTDPQSNFGMVNRELISHVDLPEQNIHRIAGELAPKRAAEEYERDINQVMAGHDARFDLILLGLGEDGHTASVFPGSAVLNERASLVMPVFIPYLYSRRVTLTLRCINSAREVMFLVTGSRKSVMVQRVLRSPAPTKELPATLIRPVDGKLLWMLDADAAAEFNAGRRT
jgi:6-phosphogluconolactonase